MSPSVPDEAGPAAGPAFVVRPAVVADLASISALVRELAAYERAPASALAGPDDFAAALFGAHPAAFCHVAVVSGDVVGFALWFRNFSTWLGRHGIYLEDLFVRPEFRGLGIGRALLTELARIAVANGYGRLEWWVLDWNTPAHAFYRSLGAEPMDEWTVWRLTGDALTRLGES